MFPKLETVITPIPGRQMSLTIYIRGLICGCLFANGNGYHCIRGVFLPSSVSSSSVTTFQGKKKDSTEAAKGAGTTSFISSESHLVKMLDLIFFLYEHRYGCKFSFFEFISPDAVTLCSLLNRQEQEVSALACNVRLWTSSVADASLLRS